MYLRTYGGVKEGEIRMEVKSQSNIKSRFFSKERVRSKTSSVMIVPKKIKGSKNSQLQFTLINEKLPLNYLIIAFQLLVGEWEDLFNEYTIYRAFLDEKSNDDIKLLISFNTATKLASDEGDKIIRLVLPRLKNILANLKEPLNNQEREIELLNNEIEERKEMLDKLIALKNAQDLNFEKNIKMKLVNLQNKVTLNEKLSDNLKRISEQLSSDKNKLLEDNQVKDKRIVSLEKNLESSRKDWNSNKEQYVNKIEELKSKLSYSEKECLFEQNKNQKKIKEFEEANNQLQTRLEDFQIKLVTQEKTHSEQDIESENKINELLLGLENQKIISIEKIDILKNDLKMSSEKLSLEKKTNEEKISRLDNQIEKITLERDTLVQNTIELKEQLMIHKEKLETERRVSVEEIDVLQNELEISSEKLNVEKANKEEQVSRLKDNLKQTMSEKEALEKKISELEDKLSDSKKELQTEKKENKEKIEDLNKLLEDTIEIMTESKTQVTDNINQQGQEVNVPVKVSLNKTVSNKSSDYNFTSIQNSWDELFEAAQSNYLQLNNNFHSNQSRKKTTDVKAKSNEEKNSIRETEKIEQTAFNTVGLTEEEKKLKEAFFDHDLSSFNNKVSYSAKEYKAYIYNASFLKLRWQKALDSNGVTKNKLIIDTFKPYVENIEEFLENLTSNTKNNLLNKEKIMIKKHDLNLLKAYNKLSNYLN